MVQLAKRRDANTVTRLEEIAQCEDVSVNFLVQIMNDLKRANLVDSKRGKAGGYKLSMDPEEITLFEIVAAVEPAMVSKSRQQSGESAESIATSWELVSKKFEQALLETTLSSMVGADSEPMFYI